METRSRRDKLERNARTVTQAKLPVGKVILGPITVPKTCTFAIIENPQGAPFSH